MFKPNVKKLIVELDGEWEQRHRDDDRPPMEEIKAELAKDKTLVVKDASRTAVSVVYSENTADYTGIKNCVLRLLAARYTIEKGKKIVLFRALTVSEEEIAAVEKAVEDEAAARRARIRGT